METHIATIPSKSTHGSNSCGLISWHTLHAAKFTFDKPFCLHLEEGQFISVQQVVRVMPKKRMVAFGTWLGRPAVIKLFFDSQHARRHMEKDMNGANLMAMNKVPTPVLYHQGASEDRRIYVLIYERIFGAKSLEELWRNRESDKEAIPLLESMLTELATQHVLGIRQRDLHFKNFLLLQNTIYTLDGGQVEFSPRILTKGPSVNSLALFISQLGVGLDGYQEKFFNYYAKLRGWLVKDYDMTELLLLINDWGTERWKNFERKIFRESTDFSCIQDGQRFGMYDRSYAGTEFLSFLKNPDALFHHPRATILKNGRSATVIKVTLDERELIIKRYNMKNVWHRLRRGLRTTRAAKSWKLAHKLNLFGIATAKPVAFIEKRVMGLRSISYYVSEYISGEHAGDYFHRHRAHNNKISTMVERISTLLKNLQNVEITHGDLKITNILVNSHEQPMLIDLDGAKEHMSLVSLRNAWQKEVKRFLSNFQSQPSIQEEFMNLLEKT